MPSTYLHALECYVAAKQEYLSRSRRPDEPKNTEQLALLYSYQHKYVTALLKQLPAGTAWPGTSRLVSMHPPNTFKATRARQGPFLLPPAPRHLEYSEGGDATDIAYVSSGGDTAEDVEEEVEQLGLVLVTYQEGQVDVFCDVEKVEARWDVGQVRYLGLFGPAIS